MRITPRSFGTPYLAAGHWLLAIVICQVLGIVLPVVAQTGRAPVPDNGKQREIARLLEETYELNKLESTGKKQQAVKKLQETSRDDSLSLDERYVVLVKILNLAQEISDTGAWRESLDRLGTTYDVDTAKETSQRLKSYLDSASSSAAFRGKAIDDICDLILLVASADRYDDAESLLAAADAAALRIKASSTIKQAITKARASVADREKAWKQFEAASKKLAANADDPAANLIVGRWLALYQSQWPEAATRFLKSNDAKWRLAGEREQRARLDPAQQVAAGDTWWDLALAENSPSKTALMIHAGDWYDRANSRLTAGIQKQLVTKRLAEIAALKPVPSAKPEIPVKAGLSATGPDTASREPMAWIDLLDWAEGVDWAPRGINWNGNVDGRLSKAGVTLKSLRAVRFPLPAIIDGDYEMEVEFTRIEGQESVSVFFPVGTHNLQLECGTVGNTVSGINWIDGKSGVDEKGNETTRRPGPLSNGVRHRLFFRVKRLDDQAEFHIDLDDEKDYIQWKGPYSDLTNVDSGDWRLTMVQHPWIGSWLNVTRFHKVRVRMLSGTIRRDVITPADREADLKPGFVRLVGQPALSPKVGWADFLVNQVPWQLEPGEAERIWPLITREPTFCKDYYGTHAPCRLKCEIPVGAKSFSAIASNQASRTTRYQVLVDGQKVYDSGVTGIAIIKVEIPVKSRLLELVAEDVGNASFDHVYWCYPRFHVVDKDKITSKMLEGNPGPLKFAIAAGEVHLGKLSHNESFHPEVHSPPLDYSSAVPCDEYLFGVATSSVIYEIPVGMTRFSAIGYNVRSNHVKFEVWSDARKLYESPVAGIVPIQVKLPPGTKRIELKVDELGTSFHDYSMWCYPRLHKK